MSGEFGYNRNLDAAPAMGGHFAVAAKPAVSAMNRIAPNLNLNIVKPQVDAVKSDGGGAVGLAKQGQAALQSAGQDCKAAVAGGIDAIKKVQSEALAACGANGVGNVHPNTNTAPNSVAGMAMGSVADVAMGKGSMGMVATGMSGAADGASLYDDMKKGMSGKAPEEIVSAVEATLRVSHSGNPQASTGIIQDADATPRLDNDTSIDWNEALDSDPDFLKNILSFDGENLECFPDLKAVQDLGLEIDSDVASLEGVKTQAITLGEVEAFGLENTTAQAPVIDAAAFGVGRDDQMMVSAMAMSAAADAPADPGFDREAEFQRYLNEQNMTHSYPSARVA